MKRNVIKALVLLFVLLAIFAVSGCEREQGGEGEYIEKSLLYISASILTDDLPNSSPKFVYSEAGQKSKANLRGTGIFQADGTPVSIELAGYYRDVDTGYRYIYEFDSQGRPIRDQYFEINVKDGITLEYVYDDEGRYISEQTINSQGDIVGRTENKYNSEGYMTQHTKYNADGNVAEISHYLYDENGNLIKETNTDYIYYEGGVIVESLWEYEHEYDTNGNLLQTTTSDKDGLVDKTTNTYDKKGNLILRSKSSGNYSSYEYNARGILTREENVHYSTKKIIEYDRKGNKRKETSYSNDEIKYIIEYVKDGYKTRSFPKSGECLEKICDKFGNVLTAVYFEDGNVFKRYAFEYDGDGYRMSQVIRDASNNIIDVEYYDRYERTVRKEIYDGGVMTGFECYLYDDPKYTGDADFPLRSSKLRTEYFDANEVLIKYTEYGAVDKTYDAQGNEIE